jgi:hypothetical protein
MAANGGNDRASKTGEEMLYLAQILCATLIMRGT